ncbi:hypothetical protein [Methylomonas sp. MgM2]
MNKIPDSIAKNPELKPAEDYYRLRREGIGFIAQMAGALWTDYNTHDPGITIHESLCYAITDLAYRNGWDIADLLMPATPSADPEQPYPNQTFFTARDILTVNPLTPDDFRRLLIDLEPVRNAWVFCRECACDAGYYAWCDKGRLNVGYQLPTTVNQTATVAPQGLYDVLLELESDPRLGDLNDRTIQHRYSVFDSEGRPHATLLELRFPEWGLVNPAQWQLFLNADDAFAQQNGASFGIKVGIGAAKGYDVLSDAGLDDDAKDQYLRDHWRQVWYLRFELELQPGLEKIVIEPASLRLFGDMTAKSRISADAMRGLFEDATAAGFIRRYREKLKLTLDGIASAKKTLRQRRNLDEDYCRIQLVGIEDVSVCADVEVAPDADIERVQAEIWLRTEQYLNPPVPFYSLQELLAENRPVEEIFDGPELDNGFLKAADLDASALKSVLRVSDLVNSLMDIDGIVAVNNLLLSKYDQEGQIVKGAADPTWTGDGTPVFAADKISAAWLLFVSPLHQPRLHRHLSRFLFFKNGLPFLPRPDEAYDTLIQLRGERERPKIKNNADKDLPIPSGRFLDPEAYFPLQHGFPPAYGIGPEGLPPQTPALRQAQARQLKAYLLVYEQILANALAQIAHAADLFSLSAALTRTYFVKLFDDTVISAYSDLIQGLGLTELQAMTETRAEFYERRNRFLDHVMARFGEQFKEYALMLTQFQGPAKAQDRLIADKIAFLSAYPAISHDRGKAFDYALPLSQDNQSGVKKRISLLLGFPDLRFDWTVTGPDGGPYSVAYELHDRQQTSWFSGSIAITAADAELAEQSAYHRLLTAFSRPASYSVDASADKYRLTAKESDGTLLGQSALLAKSEAVDLQNELLRWAANERAIVVEHLLLRPKFPGDALYPVCPDGDCRLCGDEDPYSFRMTWVMPGWTAPYNDNLEMRGFADRTVRKEIPAHLLAKICWVGNDGFIANDCDPIVTELADWLLLHTQLTDDTRPTQEQACACAIALYRRFSAAFGVWYEDKTLKQYTADTLKTELETLFAPLNDDGLDCAIAFDAASWQGATALLIEYFRQIVGAGWQFERFEDIWRLWLAADAKIDWTEERLPEQLSAMLAAHLAEPSAADLCACSGEILAAYGDNFFRWLQTNVRQGRDLDDLAPFQPAEVIVPEAGGAAPTFCADLLFQAGTSQMLQTLLDTRYTRYLEVSYRLWRVVIGLAELRNTYPAATLHDCDDGSDANPVRLGSTALGSLHAARQPSDTL